MQRGSPKNRILDFWLGVPLLQIFATLRRRRPHLPPIHRLGVLCSPALGDTLLFSAVLQDLRAHFDRQAAIAGEPPVEIVHFCMNANLAAAELIPGADLRVLINLTRPFASIRRIRAERLDALFDFSSWQRLTALYTMLSGARFTLGFSTPGQYRTRGYDRTAPHGRDLHELENFRALLHAVAIPTCADPCVHLPGLPTREPDQSQSDQDVVVFHPWASGQHSGLREWPQPRWVQLALALGRPATLFFVTGAPSDAERMKPLLAAMQAAGLDAQPFVGADGFRSLAGLLRRARLVVSVNTGVMHLAAIAGAPTVSLNGPTSNQRWGPIGPRALGVQPPGDGCGFLHLGFEFKGRPTDCMERISVAAVLEAAQAVEHM